VSLNFPGYLLLPRLAPSIPGRARYKIGIKSISRWLAIFDILGAFLFSKSKVNLLLYIVTSVSSNVSQHISQISGSLKTGISNNSEFLNEIVEPPFLTSLDFLMNSSYKFFLIGFEVSFL